MTRVEAGVWDESRDSTIRSVQQAKLLGRTGSVVLSRLFVGGSQLFTSGVWRGVSVIYGIAAGVAIALSLSRLVARRSLHKAVQPIRGAIVPGMVAEAHDARLARLLLHSGTLIGHVRIKAESDEFGAIELTASDVTKYPEEFKQTRGEWWLEAFTKGGGGYSISSE